MGNELKEEFKGFIEELTVKICKDVLIEQLVELNNNLKETSKKHKGIVDKYRNVTNILEEEVNVLNNNNSNIETFIECINDNNTKVNDALKLINGEHKKVIDKIFVDSNKIFADYNRNVQQFNELERKKFIAILNEKLINESKIFANEMRNNLDVEKIILISEAITSVDKKMLNANLKLNNIENELIDINKKNEQIQKNFKELNNKLNEISSYQVKRFNQIEKIVVENQSGVSELLNELSGNRLSGIGIYTHIYAIIILLGIIVIFK